MNNIIKVLFVVILGLGICREAFAVGSAGFENATFTPKSLAEGNAVTARPDEPGAISYNPAGIVDVPGIQLQTNASFLSILTFQKGTNGEEHQSTGTLIPVPTTYLTINPGRLLWDRVAFGIGQDVPFGLSDQYDSGSPSTKYTGFNNYLQMVALKPVMAVKMCDWLSVGGGPMYYNIYNFGGIEAYPNKVVPGGLSADGQLRLNTSGNSWGWHMGVLVKPHKKHQLGFYFRSPVTMMLRGQAKVENSTSGYFETGAHAKMNLPLNFTFAYAFRPTDRSSIEADFGYTRWSIHRRLYITPDSVNARENIILNAMGKTDKDYSDGYSLHLGGDYDVSKKLQLRGGSLFYWAVVPDDHFIPAVPDANRFGVTMGGSYKLNKNTVLELSYVNIFTLRRTVSNNISQTLGGDVNGRYFTYLQQFSVGITMKWDDIFKPRPQETGNGRSDRDIGKR